MRLFFGIFTVLFFLFSVNAVFADCNIDNDWLGKPCLDMPPYPKSTLVEIWNEYHSIKGETWMEGKKSEMNFAIEKGILDEWLSYGIQYNNYQNHNVYFYYFLHDDAPTIGKYHEDLIRDEDKNKVIRYSDSSRNPSEIIVTYYYISTGGLLVLSPLVAGSGIVGFLVWRKRR